MPRTKVALIPVLALSLLGACGRTALEELLDAGAAGKPGTGGEAGQAGTGGNSPGTGGVSGTGGVPGTGGNTPGTGGIPGTGGAATGGSPGTGGIPGTGGSPLRDAGPDLAPDVREDPPRVNCPALMPVRPRRTVHLEGMVYGPARFVATWRVVTAPGASMVSRASVAGTGIDLVPDVVGTYLLRFEARDARGNSDACQVTVEARALPPVVVCPRESRVPVGQELALTGSARDDDGPVKLLWSVSPTSASLAPVDQATTRFLAGSPGLYTVTFSATDIDGAGNSCSFPVRALPPPIAMCPPPGEKYVRLRAASFTARLDARPITSRWTLIKRPLGSTAEPTPRDGLTTEVTPDVLGEYVLHFIARSLDGAEAQCATSFTAVSEPPDLQCPDLETTPLSDTDISVTANDNGSIVRWDWALAQQPPGSAVRPMFPAGDTFTFRPDLAGDYTFTLTVTDDEMLSASCKFSVRAAAEEGLRVEMFWDVVNTDMDLHLLSPIAKRWFDEISNQDCFYANCNGASPNWSSPATDLDDPHLDIDDTDGLGPENINVDRPAPGVYRVGVHGFSGLTTSAVTVRLYCGGSRLEPRVTLGPVSLGEEQVWKAADVEITADGRCEVRKLVNPDGSALVVTRASAELAR